MALSTDSAALWSDINAIYTTLRSVQSKHGLSQTAIPNSAGGRINATDVSILNNAINALNSESHISMNTGVSNPGVGTLIYPGVINTLRTKIEGITGVCHFDSFNSAFHSGFNSSFHSAFHTSFNSAFHSNFHSAFHTSFHSKFNSSFNSFTRCTFNDWWDSCFS